jgi:glycosyltransferase involved in cell wall biosynthesis
MVEERWQPPTRVAAAWHAIKVALNVARRAWMNLFRRAPVRLSACGELADALVIAEHRSPLWTDGRAEEFVLVAGKVQNLRIAGRSFDGVVVPAGATLSFWRQIGRPSRWRGFVEGREIRGGCVVPTVAGGICQLSGALAHCAQTAGVELVERHAHSARIESAEPQAAADATVAWNYIDLRMRAPFAFRIEVRLTADELIVRLRSNAASPLPRRLLRVAVPEPVRPTARGCLTCDETACFRHKHRVTAASGRRAVLVDAFRPELAAWLGSAAESADWFVPWLRPARRTAGWTLPSQAHVHVARLACWYRMWRNRRAGGEGGARQAAVLEGAAVLARAYARRLRSVHTDLTLAQELLVPLWRSGALAGRRYEVFVSQLPSSDIQRRLDMASVAQPRTESLKDYRVDARWLDDEWAALASASRLVTAHHEVARVLRAAGLRPVLVPWHVPPVPALRSCRDGHPPTLAFPASALARKGVHEVAEAARRLQARVLVLGTPAKDPSLWHGLHVDHAAYSSDWTSRVDAVVLPAYVEHAPRPLLMALAAGLPVVASPACGLGKLTQLIEVEPGQPDRLVEAIATALRQSRDEIDPIA